MVRAITGLEVGGNSSIETPSTGKAMDDVTRCVVNQPKHNVQDTLHDQGSGESENHERVPRRAAVESMKLYHVQQKESTRGAHVPTCTKRRVAVPPLCEILLKR